MTKTYLFLAATAAALSFTACATPPPPVQMPVVVETPPVRTCIELADLRRVVIPAKTKTVIAITEIDNPPYEPIQRKEEQTRIISPEYVYYVDETGREVKNICEAGG